MFNCGEKNGNALQFVKDQTPEICLAAVKKNRMAFKYVKNIDKLRFVFD